MEIKTALITGHTSGLGKALWDRLEDANWSLTGWSLDTGVDVSNEESVRRATSELDFAPFDVVINCAGVNFIDWHEDTPIEQWDRLMNTNARSMWLVVKELLNAGSIAKPATVVNIVSNASHMPMTNSAAYNASKGAAHILTLQMNRELKKRHDITVFGVSPNKMSGTKMSDYIGQRVCELRGMTPEEAQAYQLASLPAGEETDPDTCAEFIAFLLSERQRHKYLAGCILPYGA